MRQAVADCDDENWEFVVVDWEVRACVGPGLEGAERGKATARPTCFCFFPLLPCSAQRNDR